MIQVLEAIRLEVNRREEEIAQLQRRVAGLREMEALAERLAEGPDRAPSREASKPERATPARSPKAEGGGTSAKPPARRTPVEGPKSARQGAADARAKVIQVILQANGPLARTEIAERAGMPVGGAKAPLQALVKSGHVVAEGQTKSRRYRAGKHKPHTERRAKIDQSTARNESSMADRVRHVGIRDRVLRAIAADPEALNEQRLATALREGVSDVEAAVAWLLGKEKITRCPDGTYRRNGRQMVAA